MLFTCSSSTFFTPAQAGAASRLFLVLPFLENPLCRWQVGHQLLLGALCLLRSRPAQGLLRPFVGSGLQALPIKDPFLLPFSFSCTNPACPG